LKFPEIIYPETLEARYAAVMNEHEIDLMKKMLMMDPRKRITARESIEHDWFDNLRKKDPEYAGEEDSNTSAIEGGKDSIG
jgi:serine/threonine protein kinase